MHQLKKLKTDKTERPVLVFYLNPEYEYNNFNIYIDDNYNNKQINPIKTRTKWQDIIQKLKSKLRI